MHSDTWPVVQCSWISQWNSESPWPWTNWSCRSNAESRGWNRNCKRCESSGEARSCTNRPREIGRETFAHWIPAGEAKRNLKGCSGSNREPIENQSAYQASDNERVVDQFEPVKINEILLKPKIFVFIFRQTRDPVIIVAFCWNLIGQLHPEQSVLPLVSVVENNVYVEKPAKTNEANVGLDEPKLDY